MPIYHLLIISKYSLLTLNTGVGLLDFGCCGSACIVNTKTQKICINTNRFILFVKF